MRESGCFTDTEISDLTGAVPIPPAMAAPRWNPWAELRRRNDVELGWAELSEGCRGLTVPQPDGSFKVWLQADLTRRDRTWVLAHEMIHVERERFYDSTTDPEWIRQEEEAVNDEAARRMVPFGELAWLLTQFRPGLQSERGVDYRQVADHFDVPDAVALRALRLLRGAARDVAILTARLPEPVTV